MFNRRIRWYADEEDTNIRLEFTDQDGECHRFYRSAELAKLDWQRFRGGEGTILFREEKTNGTNQTQSTENA